MQKLTVYVGDPIDVSSVIKSHYRQCHTDLRTSAVELRKQITDLIQEKLYELKSHAESLHDEWTVNSPIASRKL